MDDKYVLLKGTLLLTGAGFITKIIGFIYRIFLSQTIGAEGMGIYQLIFPIHTLCFALSVGGIQTAISRFTAARASLQDEQGARDIFVLSGILSTAIALIVSLILYDNASWFAVHILLEERCTSLLKLMVFSIPMGTLHSCVNGYYYAKKKMSIPAASQLLEQCARVGVSYGLFLILTEQGLSITPMLAVAGLVGGRTGLYDLLPAGDPLGLSESRIPPQESPLAGKRHEGNPRFLFSSYLQPASCKRFFTALNRY